jgi:uncharacterized membrane protein YccC
MKTAILLVALSACLGTARAQEIYAPPSAAAAELPDRFLADRQREEQLADRQRDEQLTARALADRRQEMIHECMDNHGSEIDCERETDTELRAEGIPWRNRVFRASPFR